MLLRGFNYGGGGSGGGERRYDEQGNFQYAGVAPKNAAETDPVWSISRLTYSLGVYVSTQVAVGVTWTGRAGHTYS